MQAVALVGESSLGCGHPPNWVPGCEKGAPVLWRREGLLGVPMRLRRGSRTLCLFMMAEALSERRLLPSTLASSLGSKLVSSSQRGKRR